MIELSDKTLIIIVIVIGLTIVGSTTAYKYSEAVQTKVAMEYGYEQVVEEKGSFRYILWKKTK